MSKHTPGPWREDRNEYDVERGNHPGWIVGPNDEPVCEYAGCGSHEAHWENSANFALALAAPELLAALLQIQRMGYTDIGDRMMVDAAIAKATGESA